MSDVPTHTKHFLGSIPPRCVPILNCHGDVLSSTWADTRPSGGPLGARFVPRALRVSGIKGWNWWMWRFDGRESIIGAEGWAQRTFSGSPSWQTQFWIWQWRYSLRVFGSAMCCGFWKCTRFPPKPPCFTCLTSHLFGKNTCLELQMPPASIPPSPTTTTIVLLKLFFCNAPSPQGCTRKWVVKSS